MSRKLSVQVVTWNSAAVIEDLIASLHRQKFSEYQLCIIDNASTDGTVENVMRLAPEAEILRNDTNRGFSAGHNQGIRHTNSPFVAIVNPDVVITEDALGRMMQRLEKDPSIGSISGKLLKNSDSSGIIDSAGITAKQSRQFLNRGEGTPDTGQFDTPQEVFGLSGAFLVLRREALESIKIGEEYFDEDLFAYKEDVDLAWRLRSAGWKNWYEPSAVIYHGRTVRQEQYAAIAFHGRQKPAYAKRLSYRNHLLVLIKNDRYRDWFFPLPKVFLYELGKFLYLMVREPKTLLGLVDVFRLLPRMLRKRMVIRRHVTVSHREVLRWFD